MFSLQQVAVGFRQCDTCCCNHITMQSLSYVGFGMFGMMMISCHSDLPRLCYPLTSFSICFFFLLFLASCALNQWRSPMPMLVSPSIRFWSLGNSCATSVFLFFISMQPYLVWQNRAPLSLKCICQHGQMSLTVVTGSNNLFSSVLFASCNKSEASRQGKTTRTPASGQYTS